MTLEDSARGAKYPWFSMEAIGEEIRRLGYPVITSAELAKCMSCKAPECYNCIDGGSPDSVGRKSKNFDLDEQIAMFPCVNAWGTEYEVVGSTAEQKG